MLLTLLLSACTTTNAASVLCNSTSCPSTAILSVVSMASGVFDLGYVYTPLLTSYSGPTTMGTAQVYQGASGNINQGGAITKNPSFFYFNVPGVSIYTIYWGNGFTTTQQNLIDNFLTNVPSSPYWTVLQTYDPNVSMPTVASSIRNIGCFNASAPGVAPTNGCNLIQYNEQAILSNLILNGTLKYDVLGIYMIFGGTDTYYQFTTNVVMGDAFTSGGQGVCGTHGVCGQGMACQNLVYTYVQMLRNSASYCNILGNAAGLTSYPNGDFSADNVIAIALHELVESIISPQLILTKNHLTQSNSGGGSAFQDVSGYEPADKCSNQLINLGQFAGNGNLRVGNFNYTVFPLWDFSAQTCSMGISNPTNYCGFCKAGASLFSSDTIGFSKNGFTDRIYSNQGAASTNLLYSFPYTLSMQSNGQVVKFNNGVQKWSAGTSKTTPQPSYYLIMQQDGNLVSYSNSSALWASGTWNIQSKTGPYCSTLQSNGALVIYDSTCKQLGSF